MCMFLNTMALCYLVSQKQAHISLAALVKKIFTYSVAQQIIIICILYTVLPSGYNEIDTRKYENFWRMDKKKKSGGHKKVD